MSNSSRCWAVVPAAGIGQRMQSAQPKQYIRIAGTTLLEHTLNSLLSSDAIQGLCVALHREDSIAQSLAVFSDPRVRTTTGAAERSGSVLAGLLALAGSAQDDDWVLVHDAARPCLRVQDIQRLINTVTQTGVGGILAEPIVDTVKQADEQQTIVGTLDRSSLWRAQTPQMFRLGELRRALQYCEESAQPVTDEASAMEHAGYPVQLVSCGSHNLKVTLPEDLQLAAFYLRGGSAQEN